MIHSYSRYLRAFALTFALVLVAGCGDDDDPAGGGPADTTPPALSTVTVVDVSHIDVTFNEDVDPTTAEATDNYTIVTTTAAATETASSGGGLNVFSASLSQDGQTVSLTTNPMAAISYDLSITGVEDVSGNAIETAVVQSFTGTTDPDITPPEVVYRSPGPNATNVPIGTQIFLTFSEGIPPAPFFAGFTLSSGAGDVPFGADSDDGAHIVVTPDVLLELGTEYTINMTGIEDEAGNVMPDLTWTFTTTNVVDTTPPTITSTSPTNGTLNVDVNTDLSVTFSEPVNQGVLGLLLYPEVGDGIIVWTNGGKTLTFSPFAPLVDNQQYTLSALPGSYEDLSGNANTAYSQYRFSTGSALATGSFTGTLSGDPTSDDADNPSGARVFAVVGPSLDDILIAGSAVAGASGSYDILNLPDDDYFALSLLDSNHDGGLDPSLGDAIGAYGVDFGIPDFDPDLIGISGGSRVTGIDFQLFDFSAIAGTVSYSGGVGGAHFVGIGLFETAGFDPMNAPDYTTEASWPDFPEWGFLNMDYGFPDGSYYVGAFLDANDNLTLDFGTDPVGFYGGLPTPTAITVNNGSDAIDIVIPLEDPPVSSSSGSIVWSDHTKRTMPSWVHKLSHAIRESESRASSIRVQGAPFATSNSRATSGRDGNTGVVAGQQVTGWKTTNR